MSNPGESVRHSLDLVINELQQTARLDSAGKFTLDPSRAWSKLRQFQSQRPEEYVLWLAAAAVLGGARNLRVLAGLDRTCVEWDGAPFSEAEMRGLFEEGVQQRPGRVGHLAFAMLAALGLEPVQLVIESGLRRLLVEGEHSRLEGRPADEPAVRFFLQFRRGFFKKLRGVGAPVAEAELLKTRLLWPELKLKINGDSIRCGWAGDSPAKCRFLQGQSVCRSLKEYREYKRGDRREIEDGFCALLSLSMFQVEEGAQLTFLFDGVAIEVRVPGPIGFRALVEADPLQLDLSRSRIVENTAYESVICRLQSEAEQLAHDFVAELSDLDPKDRGYAQWLLKHLSTRNPECAGWLNRLHRRGLWLDGDSPEELLARLKAKLHSSQVDASRLAETDPWAWLWRLFGLGEGAPRPREQTLQLIGRLLERLYARSSFRVGLELGGDLLPTWLVVDGVTEDGSRFLLEAEGNLKISRHYPRAWSARALPGKLTPPPGWTCQVERDTTYRATFESTQQNWRDPAQMQAVLNCFFEAGIEAQRTEVLPCPSCRRPMEKIVLDLVLDRCQPCSGIWLDFAELDWLFQHCGPAQLSDHPSAGQCPRCDLPLQKGYRLTCERFVMECPRCQGAWLGLTGEVKPATGKGQR